MSSLTTLIFDVDGTLADTERDGHRIAFNQAFAEAGLDWHWSEALYAELLSVTGGKERIRYFVERYQPNWEPPPSGLSAFAAQLHALKTRFYLALLETGAIPLRPGVARLISEARAAGLRLAIATTTTPENVHTLLRASLGEEALTWFECIGAGDIVAHKKPAADIYHYVLHQMGVTPEQCLAFEDSDNGLRSAHGAGLRTLVTVNDYTRTQDFSAAVLVLDQLGEANQPFQVLQGDAAGATWVTIDLLRTLAQQV